MAISQAEADAIAAQANPVLKQALGGGVQGGWNGLQAFNHALQSAGIETPDEYKWMRMPDGSVSLKHQSWLARNQSWAGPLILFGGGLAGGLAAGAIGGGAAAGGSAATTIPGGYAASAASAAPVLSSGGAAAGGIGSALAKTGISAGAGLLSRAMGSHGNDTSTGMTPELEAQLKQLMQLQVNRAQRQEPVHEAAMQLAMRLSPGTSVAGPRLQKGIQQASQPQAPTQTNPAVLAAIQRLMGGQ
jgi:hypothetical protein